MIYDGEWAVLNIMRNCPSLNYRVVPFPYPTAHPDLKDNFEMGGSTIYMPSGALHKEEALKFLAYMMKPENIDMFCLTSTNGNIPHSIKALKLYDNYKTNLPPEFKYFIDLALTAKPTVIPASSISDEFFSELMKLEEQIYSGKIGVQEGLKNTQDKLMEIFKEKG
jgi:ABC-type glycerol-3-phosphate transport system substrate-binding protein